MRISVRWWLTAGCVWPSSWQRADTCIGPCWASARTILRRDLSASSLKTEVRSEIVSLDTFSGDDRTLLSVLRDFGCTAMRLLKVPTPAGPAGGTSGGRRLLPERGARSRLARTGGASRPGDDGTERLRG